MTFHRRDSEGKCFYKFGPYSDLFALQTFDKLLGHITN